MVSGMYRFAADYRAMPSGRQGWKCATVATLRSKLPCKGKKVQFPISCDGEEADLLIEAWVVTSGNERGEQKFPLKKPRELTDIQ
jgi:hypothetical protein